MSRFDTSIFDGENAEPMATEIIHLPWFCSPDSAIALVRRAYGRDKLYRAVKVQLNSFRDELDSHLQWLHEALGEPLEVLPRWLGNLMTRRHDRSSQFVIHLLLHHYHATRLKTWFDIREWRLRYPAPIAAKPPLPLNADPYADTLARTFAQSIKTNYPCLLKVHFKDGWVVCFGLDGKGGAVSYPGYTQELYNDLLKANMVEKYQVWSVAIPYWSAAV